MKHERINLNNLEIPINGLTIGRPQTDHSTRNGNVTAHFKNLELRLTEYIRKAKSVIGCIAWITSEPILKELSQKDGVALVVQKEDYLRKETSDTKDHLKLRRYLYDQVRNQPWILSQMIGGAMNHMYSGPGYSLENDIAESGVREDAIDPIRCMGLANPGYYSGRMHHKFLVFCDHSDNFPPTLIPRAVWTGSFNFSNTGNKSFENAVYIEDEEIAEAYMLEFSQVSAFAEPLDWESASVNPDLRMA